ncbi:MAG TPA: Crp/Fnr family transcriptional regulator [Xanthobacteraceae bacterium]|jgi:CRP-like cAMP-binding protein|nr:Crp/Fnr family transcriptional regulator [Xanthobacteraceae bacterium]
MLASPHHRNRLLSALSPADLALLEPHLQPVPLKHRQELEKPHRKIETVYFVEVGIVSVVAIQSREWRAEVGLIGCEGMTGTSVVLGNEQSPHLSYVQIPGEALSIPAAELRRAMAASESLRGLLLRYVQTFLAQTIHTAVCNAGAKIDQRLARWILMAHDRIPRDTVALTHEFLALMLGVRRASVSEALREFSRQKLIEAKRGAIVVRNRKGIERIAGASYGVPEAEYRRLIG